MAQPRETEQNPNRAPERNPDLDRDRTIVNPESENVQGRADEEEDEFDEVEEEEEEGDQEEV